MNKYEENVKVIAAADDNKFERIDNLIKEMCQLTTILLNYKYVIKHYDVAKGTVEQDELNKVAKGMAMTISDMAILAEQMQITGDVAEKRIKRVERVAGKIKGKN